MMQLKEAESKLQNEKNSLLQQLHAMDQQALQYKHQLQECRQQLHEQQLEQETRFQQVQMQLKEAREQFGALQQQYVQLQQQAATDSAASSSTVHQLQKQLIVAQEKQHLEEIATANALANCKQAEVDLHAARDRVKYLEIAISGHVTRLEAQATELSGTDYVVHNQ